MGATRIALKGKVLQLSIILFAFGRLFLATNDKPFSYSPK